MNESATACRKSENERAAGSAKCSADLTDPSNDAFFQAEAEKEDRENKAKEKSHLRCVM